MESCSMQGFKDKHSGISVQLKRLEVVQVLLEMSTGNAVRVCVQGIKS